MTASLRSGRRSTQLAQAQMSKWRRTAQARRLASGKNTAPAVDHGAVRQASLLLEAELVASMLFVVLSTPSLLLEVELLPPLLLLWVSGVELHPSILSEVLLMPSPHLEVDQMQFVLSEVTLKPSLLLGAEQMPSVLLEVAPTPSLLSVVEVLPSVLSEVPLTPSLLLEAVAVCALGGPVDAVTEVLEMALLLLSDRSRWTSSCQRCCWKAMTCGKAHEPFFASITGRSE